MYKINGMTILEGKDFQQWCPAGHVCTSRCYNDIECPCDSEHVHKERAITEEAVKAIAEYEKFEQRPKLYQK